MQGLQGSEGGLKRFTRDQSGRKFNVEMQVAALPVYRQRILYYWSKLHQQQIGAGEQHGAMRPIISISLLDHILFPQLDRYHSRFCLLEETEHFALTEDVVFHFFELPKFKKGDADIADGLDNWLYFLRYVEKMDTEILPKMMQTPMMRHAVEEWKMLTQNEIERERYESRRKAQMDLASHLYEARLGEKDLKKDGKKCTKKPSLKFGRSAKFKSANWSLAARRERPRISGICHLAN